MFITTIGVCLRADGRTNSWRCLLSQATARIPLPLFRQLRPADKQSTDEWHLRRLWTQESVKGRKMPPLAGVTMENSHLSDLYTYIHVYINIILSIQNENVRQLQYTFRHVA